MSKMSHSPTASPSSSLAMPLSTALLLLLPMLGNCVIPALGPHRAISSKSTSFSPSRLLLVPLTLLFQYLRQSVEPHQALPLASSPPTCYLQWYRGILAILQCLPLLLFVPPMFLTRALCCDCHLASYAGVVHNLLPTFCIFI